jgi:peroxiredoxin-like protein
MNPTRRRQGEMTKDLSFNVELRWARIGRTGAGEIQADGLTLDLSGPKSMGGRGVGTNPEELLVCAVSSCYIATLFEVLRRAKLPADSLAVSASGKVTGFPMHARFAGVVVMPTILGSDVARQAEYEAAAVKARDRCFIGQALAPDVSYEVGSVDVREQASLSPPPDKTPSVDADGRRAGEDAAEQVPAWPSGT